MHAQKLLLGALLTIAAAVYLFLSPTGGLVLTPSGNIAGFGNRARTLFQGHRFWRQQLFMAEKELRGIPQLIAFVQNPLIEADYVRWLAPDQYQAYLSNTVLSAALTDEYIQRNTTPAQYQAHLLRRASDQIEEAEKQRIQKESQESAFRKREADLDRIITIIQSRLGGL